MTARKPKNAGRKRGGRPRGGTSPSTLRAHRHEERDRAARSAATLIAAIDASTWFAIIGNAQAAARHVLGPAASDADVAELAKIAEAAEWTPYREGSIAAQAKLASMARQLMLTAFIRTIELIPPGSRAFAVSKLHEVTEALGGSDAAFSELVIVEEWSNDAA